MAFPDLKKRLITGLGLGLSVLVLIIISFFSCHARWVLVGLGFIAVLLAAAEYSIFAYTGVVKRCLNVAILVVPATFVVTGMLNSPGCSAMVANSTDIIWLFWGAAIATLGMACMAAYAGRTDLEAVKAVLVEMPIALMLVGVGGGALIMLAMVPHSPGALLWLLLTVIANDIGAYFAGVKFGGKKLSPALSPKKTFSGSAGGFAAGVLMAVAVSPLLNGYSVAECAGGAILVVLAGQLGDLLKSYLKRLHDVKDSGKILPGHGGVFDRIDGILAAAPLVLLFTL